MPGCQLLCTRICATLGCYCPLSLRGIFFPNTHRGSMRKNELARRLNERSPFHGRTMNNGYIAVEDRRRSTTLQRRVLTERMNQSMSCRRATG